jgi:membrane dipeptidase
VTGTAGGRARGEAAAPHRGAVTTAAALHRDAVVVDAHNDLLVLCARRAPREQAGYFRTAWLPQLRAGGVDVQVLPVFVSDEYRHEAALRQTLRMLETAWRIADGNPDAVRVCLTGADITRALADGVIALVLALEGCEAVGTDVALFGALHRMGVRMASFTHFGRTMLADGSGEDGTGGRLTAAGVDAVAACEELGIVLDVSHLGAACTDHLLELARRPVVASHSSAYAVRAHHRNLTDERLRGVAATGGVIGVNAFASFVDAREHTVDRVVDHIEHVASTVGPAHTGLGPDFIQEVVTETRAPFAPLLRGTGEPMPFVPGLEGPAGLPLLTERLLARGWAADDVRRVLGGSFHDVLVSALGG